MAVIANIAGIQLNNTRKLVVFISLTLGGTDLGQLMPGRIGADSQGAA